MSDICIHISDAQSPIAAFPTTLIPEHIFAGGLVGAATTYREHPMEMITLIVWAVGIGGLAVGLILGFIGGLMVAK